MTFGLNMGDVPFVTSYDAAVSFYNRAEPWRNGGDDRPLIGKRNRNYGVRMKDNGDVIFRYDRTDVIAWHSDGSYTIDNGGYNSRATCTFATNFMPHGHGLSGEARHLRVDDHVYPVWGHRVTVSGTGVPSGEGLGQFRTKTADRKKARIMLHGFGYYEYAAWFKLMYPMVKGTLAHEWRRAWLDNDSIRSMLKVEEAWHELMVSRFGEANAIRAMMYDAYGDAHDIWNYTYEDKLPRHANLRRYEVVKKGE